MSNDLISREKLIDSLNLWGCYKHENPKAYDTLMLYEVLEAIEDQPTAYDADKVLEDVKDAYECNECNNKSCGINTDGYVCQEVIEAVKRGGIGED